MISTYHEYIERFIIAFKNQRLSFPGEHHFVAAYLAPKIYRLTGIVPSYINPDGTKRLGGDLLYDIPPVSIEVKFQRIVFTKSQWGAWIERMTPRTVINPRHCPTYFVGISSRFLVIQD